MMPNSEHFTNLPEGGDRLPHELRELDDRLARHGQAVRAGAPAGLADRVYAASVGLLPQRAILATIGRSSSRRAWWGRAAMAASVGLVVVIGSTLSRGPLEEPLDTTLVAYQQELAPSAYADVAREDGAVGHLLSTADLTSYDEVAGELESLISEIGM